VNNPKEGLFSYTRQLISFFDGLEYYFCCLFERLDYFIHYNEF